MNPYRTRAAGELRAENAGERARLAGWVHRRRDHGGLIFIDLRDRWGITQVTFDPDRAELFAAAERLRPEWSISIEGEVTRRPEGNQNPELPTGEIEVEANELRVLNESATPPFEIDRERDVDEILRLKYRYLDLRRARMRDNILFRHRVVKHMRDYLDERGFVEIETPLLTASTPEGARDYLVPARLYPGQFYALPQSPQQFKQLLMVAGFERYFQIARALRDEDQRGDRQPEHTQLDLEMSYTTQDEVLDLIEGLYIEIVEDLSDKKLLTKPIPRLKYAEAMTRFGSDKPDLRFGLELKDVSEIARSSEFKVFRGAVEAGGSVRGIAVGELGDLSRREIDELTSVAATGGARGLAHFRVEEDGLSGPVTKFFSDEEQESLRETLEAQPGDWMFFVADRDPVVFGSLNLLRLHLRDRLGLVDPETLAFCWITDFPLFEWNEEEERVDPMHHMFTMPREEDLPLLDTDPLKIIGQLYDLVANGSELLSGSIRIHRPDLQQKVFAVMGMDEEEANRRFGAILTAFRYGAPPHGGIGAGIDRLIAILRDEPNIREVMAFPKTQAARDEMMDAPGPVAEAQLAELGISVRPRKKSPGEG
ncbi:MAG: aspartate--tRNA ligase [Actinomycetota bacterium]|nr:aspartate--tRNA ligase [Actinomycetota bacterium]MDQ3568198.1 aspartate--tRNA ligase [Actinomycetota bacterium]